jgi:hypothetical protein
MERAAIRVGAAARIDATAARVDAARIDAARIDAVAGLGAAG